MERLKERPAFEIDRFMALVVLSAIAILAIWWLWTTIQDWEATLDRTLKITGFLGEDTTVFFTSEQNTQPVVNTGSLYT